MAEKKLRIPPQDLEAEQSVIGALMMDKEAVALIADIVEPKDFYKVSHGIIYEAIHRLWDKREPVDILSLSTELKKTNQLEDIGGSSYLSELVNSVPSASNIEHYAKIVKEKGVLRDLITASSQITENAFSPKDEIEEMLDDVEQRIFAISQRSLTRQFSPIKEDLKEAYSRIEMLHKGGGQKFRGVPTGFPSLDNILSGLQKSDFVVLGARPSFGKTSFALDIARNVAVRSKLPVGFFSLEMSREQVVDRLISAEGNIDLWKLRTGRLKDEDFALVQSAFDKLDSAPLFIDDTPSPTIVQIRSMARRLQTEHGQLSLLIIDYLQLIQPRRGQDNTVAQVTEISRGIKSLARELDVPVLTISQLSRAVDQRELKIPRLSDLRESGSIEQDADVVMFIYPKDMGRLDTPPENENITEIIVAKHRNGPQGTVRLFFDKQRASFQEVDQVHDNANT